MNRSDLGDLIKGHKSLTKKQLLEVWEWAEARQGSSTLADAYINACGLIASYDCSKLIEEEVAEVFHERADFESLGRFFSAKRVSMVDDLAWITRDQFGHLIRIRIKFEKMKLRRK